MAKRTFAERMGNNPWEIFFSPLHVSASRAELSSPLCTPPLTPTPTQESFDAEQTALNRPKPKDSGRQKLKLKSEHVEQLVEALARSQMMQRVVQNDKDALSVSGSPSTSSKTESSVGKSSTLPTTVSPSRPASQSQKAVRSPAKPSKPLKVNFRGIAITNPRKNGTPIRYISKGYRFGANTLHVGNRSYLNAPFANDTNHCLRFEQYPGSKTPGKVILAAVNEVLDRTDGSVIFHLVAEMDVTEGFTSAVMAELAEKADLQSTDEIEIVDEEQVSDDDNPIDWCQIADELEEECQVADAVQTAKELFLHHLDMTNCCLQTLELVSELERLLQKHEDFMILRLSGSYHKNGVPDGVSVPWISQHLEWRIHDGAPMPEEQRRTFRLVLVEMVAKRTPEGKPFSTTATWDGEKRVFGVPMLKFDGEELMVWVCFVSNVSQP